MNKKLYKLGIIIYIFCMFFSFPAIAKNKVNHERIEKGIAELINGIGVFLFLSTPLATFLICKQDLDSRREETVSSFIRRGNNILQNCRDLILEVEKIDLKKYNELEYYLASFCRNTEILEESLFEIKADYKELDYENAEKKMSKVIERKIVKNKSKKIDIEDGIYCQLNVTPILIIQDLEFQWAEIISIVFPD